MARRTLFAILASTLVVAGGATAFAAQNSENDGLAVGQAKVSLTQAVAAAEQK